MTNPYQRYTTEEKLMLALCHLNFSKDEIVEARSFMKEIKDWNHFVRLVNEHSIIALTDHNIRQAGLMDHVPKEAMRLLDNGLMQSMIRNTWLVKRWKEVNTILTEAGVKHLLLKGMALEYTVYGAKGLRQMADNDILVKKDDLMKAFLLLQKYGFEPDSIKIKSPLHKKIITEISNHIPALRKEGYSIEIHHKLFYEADKNEALNEAIENAIEIEIEGTRAYVLKDDIHLDFLRKHLQNHLISGTAGLKLYNDIELIKSGGAPPFPNGFLANPSQPVNREQIKNTYRAQFYSLPHKIRLRFLLGDIFPSMKWMKNKHDCGTVKSILLYPRRLGKILWLLKA